MNWIEESKFKYVETQADHEEVILLLHGLLGELSNFDGIINGFKDRCNVVFPELPIMTLPLDILSVGSLVDHIYDFIQFKNFSKVTLLGNSLGGHIALLFALKYPDFVHKIVLTGSSGLFENSMGNSFPRRGDYEYIEKKAKDTFYDPNMVTKELVDRLYTSFSDRDIALRTVKTAKSAIRQNLEDHIKDIHHKTLLIWGRNDNVTPPFVGEKFNELLLNSELHFINECGHAPMMEKPTEFNLILEKFLVS